MPRRSTRPPTSCSDKLAVPIPNEHTDRYVDKGAGAGIYIQTGTFLEVDPRWPGSVFNTTCLIGPDGLLGRYRKVNPWLPWEVHASPHDLPGYDEPLFPVVETEIGRLGAAICYDWLFPEAIRALALAGAEVLIRVSAYMDPWGATPPLDWWTLFNRARAVENFAYVVAANQGASAANYPPFSWPGGQHDRRLRRPDPRAGRPRPGREDRGRTDRPGRPPGRAAAPPRASSPFPPPGRSLYWSLRPAHLSSRRASRLKSAMISRRSLSAVALVFAISARPGASVSPIHRSDPYEEPDDAFERPRAASLVLIAVSGLLAAPACQTREEPAAAPGPSRSRSIAQAAAARPHRLERRDPAGELDAVMAAHFKGLGLMEQYEYRKAAEAFRDVRTRAPGWIPGSINLAIALLNDSGVQAEAAKKSGRRRGAQQLRRGPAAPGRTSSIASRTTATPTSAGDHPRAAGRPRRSPQALQARDRARPQRRRLLVLGREHADRPGRPDPARRTRAGQGAGRALSEGARLDPYLTPAIYKLSFAYRLAGEPDKQKELLDRWREINPDRQKPVPGPGNSADKVYGEMGKYATVDQPVPPARAARSASGRARRNSSRPEPLAREARRRRPLGRPRTISRASTPCSAASAPGSGRPSPRSTPTATASSTSIWPPRSSGPRACATPCC